MSKLALAGIDRGRPDRGPETVHLDITNSCNTNCITCWDHSELLRAPRSAAWKRMRVELAPFVSLLDDIASLGGLRAIVLSGMGEPFTHPDVYAMIEAVKQRGLHLTIITNLVACDVERVLSLGVDQLLIGIHGASERAYLDFHPSFGPAHYARLLDMLGRFRAAGRRYKHVQVISGVNAHELVEMVELGHRYEARQINFKLASLGEGTEASRITPAQREHLRSELLPRATARAAELGVETNLDVFASQLAAGGGRTASIADVGCFMGFAYARVLVDGTVLYCCNTAVRVAKLDEGEPFSKLWHGPAWNALRDRFRTGDYLPSCDQCGKLNQNVKLAKLLESKLGRARLLEVTGRGPNARARRRLPLAPPPSSGEGGA